MSLTRSLRIWRPACVRFFALLVMAVACGEDTADDLGVGSECEVDSECRNAEDQPRQRCLTQFKGGYCGIEDCTSNAQCPQYSACVRHDDGNNYCFRTCLNKLECNANRTEASESNCSSSVEYVSADKDSETKACIPPSSG